MKIIKYNLSRKTEDAEILAAVELLWNEANEEIAKAEAYNGEYIIEDNGLPEPEPTPEDRIAELEEALELLLTGVTE